MNNLLSKRDAPQHRPLETLFAFPVVEGRDEFCSSRPTVVYPPGCRLFRQGFTPDAIYCIHSGLVKLSIVTPGGKELLVCVRSAGWMLGVAPLILQKPYQVTAETLTECELHHCSAGDVRALSERDIHFARLLLQLVSQELYDHRDQLLRLGTLTARQRLEDLLLRLATPQNGMRVELPLKLEEIARWIAVEPSHLSRLLKQMEEGGFI